MILADPLMEVYKMITGNEEKTMSFLKIWRQKHPGQVDPDEATLYAWLCGDYEERHPMRFSIAHLRAVGLSVEQIVEVLEEADAMSPRSYGDGRE